MTEEPRDAMTSVNFDPEAREWRVSGLVADAQGPDGRTRMLAKDVTTSVYLNTYEGTTDSADGEISLDGPNGVQYPEMLDLDALYRAPEDRIGLVICLERRGTDGRHEISYEALLRDKAQAFDIGLALIEQAVIAGGLPLGRERQARLRETLAMII